MIQLVLNEVNARKIFPTAPPEIKQILEDTWGKQFFEQEITDRVKTFEDACREICVRPDAVYSNDDTPDERGYKMSKVITRALNGPDWEPDWNNFNQRKWYPRFYMNSPGFRSYGAYYGIACTNATGDSRLCFKSEELAKYAGTQFIDIYKDLLT